MRLPKHRPPTHPGKMLLKEFLEPLGITQTDCAHHLGWTTTRLNEIIKGKRGVTPESALQLADVIGMTPGFWLGLQQDYDLWKAQQDHQALPKHPKMKAS